MLFERFCVQKEIHGDTAIILTSSASKFGFVVNISDSLAFLPVQRHPSTQT
ncbi:hypothetical protein DPMN_136188 [Dreissena polymorpha]|uniref:Uncharacterized protein n=1 Tax=Dreissena polymorpha TaxID=45954 RepID=A0A9D4G3D0_DREPO|nr:hypothetical protein DPMN_136188 [Dreissena polymorpha]